MPRCLMVRGEPCQPMAHSRPDVRFRVCSRGNLERHDEPGPPRGRAIAPSPLFAGTLPTSALNQSYRPPIE